MSYAPETGQKTFPDSNLILLSDYLEKSNRELQHETMKQALALKTTTRNYLTHQKQETKKLLLKFQPVLFLDNKASGQNICGYYIKYDSKRFSAGNQVQSIFVYNPETILLMILFLGPIH